MFPAIGIAGSPTRQAKYDALRRGHGRESLRKKKKKKKQKKHALGRVLPRWSMRQVIGRPSIVRAELLGSTAAREQEPLVAVSKPISRTVRSRARATPPLRTPRHSSRRVENPRHTDRLSWSLAHRGTNLSVDLELAERKVVEPDICGNSAPTSSYEIRDVVEAHPAARLVSTDRNLAHHLGAVDLDEHLRRRSCCMRFAQAR